MTTVLSPTPVQRFVDSSGNALSGGKLFTYIAGTTTKQSTFTDSTGNTANTNPIILNSRGECNLWLTNSQSYKFVLSPSTDTDPPTNPIWTVDNVVALNNTFTSLVTMSGAALNEAFTTLGSASTVNIGAATANYIQITGTTTITAFDTIQAGTQRVLEFASSLTLTNNASILLPASQNITTFAGDCAIFRSEGLGVWRCISYMRGNQGKTPTVTTLITGSGTYNTPAGCVRFRVRMVGAGGGGSGTATSPTLSQFGGGGNDTTFSNGGNTARANGANGGSGTTPGSGFLSPACNLTGSVIVVTFNGAYGGAGFTGATSQSVIGGFGATSALGAGGEPGFSLSTAGSQPSSGNFGAGGGGAYSPSAGSSGGGGGAGNYLEFILNNPASSYTYVIPAGGTAGPAGTGGFAGGAGSGGAILIEEHYY